MTALLAELPYQSDSTPLFAAIARKPWAMWLDSGRPQSKHGRYDIMVADPVITLTTRGDLTEICTPTSSEISRQNPFDLVRDYMGRQQKCDSDLPFMGGAGGIFWLRFGTTLRKPAQYFSTCGKSARYAGRHLRLGASGGSSGAAQFSCQLWPCTVDS